MESSSNELEPPRGGLGNAMVLDFLRWELFLGLNMSSWSSLSSCKENEFVRGNGFIGTVGGLACSSNALEPPRDGLGDAMVLDFLRWELFLGLNMSLSSSLSSCNEDDFLGGNCFGGTVGGLATSSNKLELPLGGLGDVNVMDFLHWELFLGLNMSSSSSLSSCNEDDFLGGNCFGRTVGGLRSSSNELERVLDGLGDVNVMDFLRWELFLGLNMSSSSSSCDEWDIFRGNSFVGTVGWVESTRNESESPRGGLGDVIKALDFLRWELLLGLDLSLSSSGFFRGNSFVGTVDWVESTSNESESPSGGLGDIKDLDFLREELFLGVVEVLEAEAAATPKTPVLPRRLNAFIVVFIVRSAPSSAMVVLLRL
jgi:hypothetical protein